MQINRKIISLDLGIEYLRIMKVVKRVVVLSLIILSSASLKAQKVFEVNADWKANVKVYLVDANWKADLLVFKVDAGW
jgi:hypothetical protein